MQNFDFSVKTHLFFGKSRENEVGDIVFNYGFNRVLIVVGCGSVKRSGLLDNVISQLDKLNISHMLIEGIRVNPLIDVVRDKIDVVRKFKPDLILAIGGGSVIDTAKSFAVAYYYDGDPFDFNLFKAEAKKALPLGVVLTIAASGSEMSTSCVMQDDTIPHKGGFNSELVRPLFAVENPELTYTLDKNQTTYGIVDTLMHTLERFFSYSDDSSSLADNFALGLIKSVIECGKVLMKDPKNYTARSTLMLASSLSHSGYTNIGKKYKMPVHQLGHPLSAMYPNVAHGAGLAVLFPAWAKYYASLDVNKFDLFAKEVFNLSIEDKLTNAIEGIKALEDYFFITLGMPKNFVELGIPDVNVEKLADLFSKNGKKVVAHHIKDMDRAVALEIYNKCK